MRRPITHLERLALIPLLILFAARPGSLAALELTRDGRPLATIVTAGPAPRTSPEPTRSGRKKKEVEPSETDDAYAAQVLADWVKKITGAELPITNELPVGSTPIFLGKAAVQAGLRLDDIRSPSHEALRIRVGEDRILIGGQNHEATLKAVCRFLEALGCRYFMDGPLGEVYPHTRSLSVGPLSIAEKPGLMGRNPKGPGWNARLWKAWNGANSGTFHHQHAWGHYVKPELFGTHPEFFAMGRDGQRKPSAWICTSNPDLRRYFAAQVIAAIRDGDQNPSLSPTDGGSYCQCPACKAQDDPKAIEPSSGQVSMSNRYVDFFDDVARQVAAVYPDAVLSFYCYADYTHPPTFARKLSPNLCAVIAPIRYCRLHELGHPGCPTREQQQAMIEGWSRIANRLGYYNYMYNLADGTLPFFKFTPCKKEFPYLADKGLCYMTIEVLSNWHIYGPQIYLSLRLAYDPSASADAIMEDYWLNFFGPKAAPFMKEYWMGIDAEVCRLNSHAGSFFGLQQIYTPEFLKQCRYWLDQAAAATRGEPVYAARVALHAQGFQSAAQYRQLGDAMNKGDFGAAKGIYDRMIARLEGLAGEGSVNGEYGTAYLRRFVNRPVLVGLKATTAPNKLVQVLPEPWRFAFDEANRGLEQGWQKADFDDAPWRQVLTLTKTLDAQGLDKTTWLWYRGSFTAPADHKKLALFFTEVDGWAQAYVNGQKLEPIAETNESSKGKKGAGNTSVPHEGVKPHTPFMVDVSQVAHPGQNVVALQVDHTRITELALGGILRPVLLIERP